MSGWTRWRRTAAGLVLVALGTTVWGQAPPRTPLERAVAYLGREVPAWKSANGCYSCHNNGDAVRALDAAQRHGLALPREALPDSIRWLRHPAGWKQNGGEGEFNDRELAAIQFAFALEQVTAPLHPEEPRGASDLAALRQAAQLAATFQRQNGSWASGPDSSTGSPATYGPVLATITTRNILRAANDDRFSRQLERADAWLRSVDPQTVFDAAALLYGHATGGVPITDQQRLACLDVISRGRHSDGGWGPYVRSASEPFDTALVVLALCTLPEDDPRRSWLAGAKKYLESTQFDDGSWPETTRPPGLESYAQRVSTTAWATLALLAMIGQ